MTPDQAADLAARTLAAINGPAAMWTPDEVLYADRERVASDLAGLQECYGYGGHISLDNEGHAARYADGLRRTAALYGVT